VLSDVRKGHLKKIEATMQVSDGVGLAHCLLLFRHASRFYVGHDREH
jgi:hypothetical protein